jgi:lipoprotein-anchoring transpeptidase ErfK/SrfK
VAADRRAFASRLSTAAAVLAGGALVLSAGAPAKSAPVPAPGPRAWPAPDPAAIRAPFDVRLRPRERAPRVRAFSVARVKPGRAVGIRSEPDGRLVARVGARTEFGSPTTLAVAEKRGHWLGVTSTELANGTLGWVRSSDPALTWHATRVSVRIDLSRRRLELRDGGELLRRATVGVGRAGSPTPSGRFAVTDKLAGARFSAAYGCCVLALSAHQPNTPPGWPGGNRIAIHGTANPASIGGPSSAGCVHAAAEDLRVLMRRVPLGTPVFVRR